MVDRLMFIKKKGTVSRFHVCFLSFHRIVIWPDTGYPAKYINFSTNENFFSYHLAFINTYVSVRIQLLYFTEKIPEVWPLHNLKSRKWTILMIARGLLENLNQARFSLYGLYALSSDTGLNCEILEFVKFVHSQLLQN